MAETIEDFIKEMNKQGWVLSGLGQSDIRGTGDYEFVASVRPYDDWSMGHATDKDPLKAVRTAFEHGMRIYGKRPSRTQRRKIGEKVHGNKIKRSGNRVRVRRVRRKV